MLRVFTSPSMVSRCLMMKFRRGVMVQFAHLPIDSAYRLYSDFEAKQLPVPPKTL